MGQIWVTKRRSWQECRLHPAGGKGVKIKWGSAGHLAFGQQTGLINLGGTGRFTSPVHPLSMLKRQRELNVYPPAVP